jgi:hypothetical protein
VRCSRRSRRSLIGELPRGLVEGEDHHRQERHNPDLLAHRPGVKDHRFAGSAWSENFLYQVYARVDYLPVCEGRRNATGPRHRPRTTRYRAASYRQPGSGDASPVDRPLTCSRGTWTPHVANDFLKAFQQELMAYEGADAARDFIAYSADRLG